MRLKGHVAGVLSLCSSLRKTGQGADMGHHRLDAPHARPGDGAVDAFARQQQRAFDALGAAQLRQVRARGRRVVKADELVQCGNHNAAVRGTS
jgi:hypothetical protein